MNENVIYFQHNLLETRAFQDMANVPPSQVVCEKGGNVIELIKKDVFSRQNPESGKHPAGFHSS
jgi:hypothetical protein